MEGEGAGVTRRFARTAEDFVCHNCGADVCGDGYTNHCPVCLWSRHVDINPGDRAEACRGMMEPVGLEMRRGEYVIIHRCVDCRTRRRNRAHPDDSPDALHDLARRGGDSSGGRR